MKKYVIKLGGSLFVKSTKSFPLEIGEIRKIGENLIDKKILRQIGKELAKALKELNIRIILINGAGVFGHFLVYKYLKGFPVKISTIHQSVDFLNEKVVEILSEQGLKLERIEPFKTCVYKRKGFDISKLWKRVRQVLKKGKIPSTYGDVIPSRIEGKLKSYTVISGDDLAVEIAKLWKADKIIMVTDVEGVYNKNPKKCRRARLIKRLDRLTFVEFKSSRIDVTGGLKAKVEKLLKVKRKGIGSQIINGKVRDNLFKVLGGEEDIGTLI